MPTSDPAAGATAAASGTASRAERAALLVASAAILALCVGQAPGRIVPETKLDVVVAPGTFLARALRAWDPLAAFGRVQNQAVGYLFPMGPFSAAGRAAGLPPWLTQRLWFAALLVASLWGAHRVARAVGIATVPGRVVAGLAYALAPATLAVALFQSAGQVPYALAPWVLVPLLEAARWGSPRRAAALSGLAIVAMGGVNGAATLAVLPLAVVWLATRAPGPERRRLAAWWAASVVAATLWWLVALAVSAKYGVRFTSYTETAATTTSTESAVEVLRGTGNWLGYLYSEGDHWLPGAWAMVSDRVAIAGSSLVAALGLAGLARRDQPGRRWLLPTAVVGAVAIGAGHAGTWSGALHGPWQDLLEGPLAPFRNVQKFGPVLRLPLALGLGHLVGVAVQPLPDRARDRPLGRSRLAEVRVRTPLVSTLAVGLVVLAVLPALPGRLVASGSFEEVPGYWSDATRWVGEHHGTGRALLLPGAPFGEYRWGRPLDEPLGLGDAPWAVRDLIPLGGDGSTRLLDAVDRALSGDHLPAGFDAALARAGVRYLVVRNDLDPDRRTGPSPRQVHRLLDGADGLRRVRGFGPWIADRAGAAIAPPFGPGGADQFRAVEVYRVRGAAPRATAYAVSGSLVTTGAAEALAQVPAGDLAGRAVVLDADVPEGVDLSGAVAATTDTARRKDVAFGAVRDNASYTLGRHERAAGATADPVDRLGFEGEDHLTVARTVGAATVTASSYPGGIGAQPEHQPAAAFDDDPTTSWEPGFEGDGAWVEARWRRPTRLGRVTITLPAADRGEELSLVVRTDRGGGPLVVAGDQAQVQLDQPIRWLRLIPTRTTDGDREPGGVVDVAAPGLRVRRVLVPATERPEGLPAATAEAAWLARAHADPYRPDASDEDPRLDDELTIRRAGARTLSGRATAAPGPELDRALAAVASRPGAPVTSASSRWQGIPALGAASAFDGDPRTAWVSGQDDDDPSLTVLWPEVRTIGTLRLRGAEGGTRLPRRVEVSTPTTRASATLTSGGEVDLGGVRTDRVTLTFPDHGSRPVGVAEVEVDGRRDRPAVDPATPIRLGCGQGPALRIDGRTIPTRATTTAGALAQLDPVSWEACGPVALARGPHRIEGTAAGLLRVDDVRVAPEAGLPEAAPSRRVTVERWGAESRRVRVAAGSAALLATTENANAGWRATLDGRTLTPVRVDGWRQGWVVPAGRGGDVELTYTPGTSQRLGLAVGALLVLALVALALLPRRRSPALAPTERGLPTALGVVVAVAAGVLLGGWLALLLLPLLAVRDRGRWLPWVAGLAATGAGTVVLLHPGQVAGSGSGAFSAAAQALAVLALLAVAVDLLPQVRRRTMQPAVAEAEDPT